MQSQRKFRRLTSDVSRIQFVLFIVLVLAVAAIILASIGSSNDAFVDTKFRIVSVSDSSKVLQFRVNGLTDTSATIVTRQTANRTLTLPDADGTLVLSQAGANQTYTITNQAANTTLTIPPISGTVIVQTITNQIFMGGPTTTLQGSAAGMQYSSITSNQANLRLNQFGNNAGVPGITAFKSRGTSIGALAPVQVGDVLFGVTAIGVTDNLSIPIGSTIRVIVATGGVPAGQGWVATNYELQLVPLAGPANGRKQMLLITSEGIFHIREAANSMAGTATTIAGGSVVVSNTQITATSKITLTIQDGGTVPTGFVYVSSRSIGASFTITSSTSDVGVVSYYQIWEPTTP